MTCIRVIHSLVTVLLEYIDLNEHSLLKMFIRFKFNESNLNIFAIFVSALIKMFVKWYVVCQ